MSVAVEYSLASTFPHASVAYSLNPANPDVLIPG